jgi:response regulator RpfG family c-di-GMP phosphodiesterase
LLNLNQLIYYVAYMLTENCYSHTRETEIMNVKKEFLKELKKYDISPHKLLKNIESKPDSPLNYILGIYKDMREANDLQHSYRVLNNCNMIIKNLKLQLSDKDKLCLFYCALLHDIAKMLTCPL